MCRWLAYFGDPIRPEELLYEPRAVADRAEPPQRPDEGIANDDGFGLGWYGLGDPRGCSAAPCRRGATEPARTRAQIRSPLFLAHVRAAVRHAGAADELPPVPARQWLFVHNGDVADWPHLRRELTMAVDPELYPLIEGATDSEVMFFLALTFGLDGTRSARWSGWPASSRRPGTGTAVSTRCR